MSLSAACNFTASASTVSATGTLYAAAGTLCTLALVDSTSVYHGDVSIDCDLIPEAGQQFRLNPHGWSAKFQLPPIDTVLDVTVTVSDVNGSTAQSQFNLVVVKDGQLAVTTFGADPTGSVDSLAAANAAAAALSGTGVRPFFPAGTYNLSAAPTIAADVVPLFGPGAAFTGAGAQAFVEGASVQSQVAPWNGTAFVSKSPLGTNNVSGFIPSQIATCALDLSPDFGVIRSGVGFSAWYDRSGFAATGTNFASGNPAVSYLANATPNGAPAIAFSGSQFVSASKAFITAAPWTIFVAVQIASTASAQAVVTIGDTGNGFFLGTDASGNRALYNVSGAAYTTAGTATTNWEIWSVTYDGTTLTWRVNGQQVASKALSAPASPTNVTYLGFNDNGAGFRLTGAIAYVGMFSSVLSTAQMRNVEAYLARTIGIARRPLLIVDGNSIAHGQGTVDAPVTSFAQRTAEMLGTAGWDFINNGVPGQTTPQMSTYALTHTDPFSGPTRLANVVLGWEITNDIAAGASATTAYNDIVSYCQARRAAGFKVGVGTCLSRGDVVGFDAIRDAVNTSIRANWSSFADFLVDFAADPTMGPDGAWSNTTYFNTDKIHPTDAGASILARIAYEAISNYAGLPLPNGLSLYSPALTTGAPIQAQGGPLQTGYAGVPLSGGGTTITLAQTQYDCPTLLVTDGGLTGNATVVLPTTTGPAEWTVDLTGVTFSAHTVTLEVGTNAKTVVVSTASVLRVYSDGAGKLYALTYT